MITQSVPASWKPAHQSHRWDVPRNGETGGGCLTPRVPMRNGCWGTRGHTGMTQTLVSPELILSKGQMVTLIRGHSPPPHCINRALRPHPRGLPPKTGSGVLTDGSGPLFPSHSASYSLGCLHRCPSYLGKCSCSFPWCFPVWKRAHTEVAQGAEPGSQVCVWGVPVVSEPNTPGQGGTDRGPQSHVCPWRRPP